MTEAEQKQVDGLKGKLKDFKRFLATYRSTKMHNDTLRGWSAHLVRRNEKLIRVLTAISESEEGIDTVPELARYAKRVIESMGY